MRLSLVSSTAAHAAEQTARGLMHENAAYPGTLPSVNSSSLRRSMTSGGLGEEHRRASSAAGTSLRDWNRIGSDRTGGCRNEAWRRHDGTSCRLSAPEAALGCVCRRPRRGRSECLKAIVPVRVARGLERIAVCGVGSDQRRHQRRELR